MIDDTELPQLLPPEPPPLLSSSDVEHILQHGYLAVVPPPHLISICDELARTSSAFFDYDADVKRKLYRASQGTELGFYDIPGEKQYLTIRQRNQSQDQRQPPPTPFNAGDSQTELNGIRTPSQPSESHETAAALARDLDNLSAALYTATSAYLHRILADMSRALGIHWSAWSALLATSQTGVLQMPTTADKASPTLLRMFRYEPEQGVAASHTDSGLLTLCVGKGRGLQVWRQEQSDRQSDHPSPNPGDQTDEARKSDNANDSAITTPPTPPKTPPETPSKGSWQDAPRFTILTGSTLRILSSLRAAGGQHRVVANPAGRESLVFALRPSLDRVLDLRGFGGDGEVEMRWFWKALQDTRVCVNVAESEQERRKAVVRKRREEAAKEVEARKWGAG